MISHVCCDYCNAVLVIQCTSFRAQLRLNSLEIFFNEVALFGQITVFLWKSICHKRTKNDEIFLSTILLLHASSMRRVLYI